MPSTGSARHQVEDQPARQRHQYRLPWQERRTGRLGQRIANRQRNLLRHAAVVDHQRQRFAAQIRRRIAPAIADRHSRQQLSAVGLDLRLAEIGIRQRIEEQRGLLPTGGAFGGNLQLAVAVTGLDALRHPAAIGTRPIACAKSWLNCGSFGVVRSGLNG